MELPSKDEVQRIFSGIEQAVHGYNPTPGLEGSANRAEIRELAKRLFLSTMTPQEQALQHTKDMLVLVAVRTVMKLGLLKNLPDQGCISASDLGSSSQVSPQLIERLFRILVAVGFIDQDNDDKYRHSSFSRDYINPLQAGSAAWFQGVYDECFQSMISFADYLTTQFEPPIPEPSSILNNCYNWTNNMEGQNIWVTMGSRPKRMEVFTWAFSGMDIIVPTTGSFFDFNQLATNGDSGDRAEIVDVGGGNGRVLGDIVKAHSKLDPKKCTLQDTETVLAHAHDIAKLGVKVQVIDYFKEQPVRDAKAYYMRYILHDYADGPAAEILKIVAAAMAPDSRLLIGEVIVPERITEANIDAAVIDQILLSIGGKERTVKNFAELLNTAGLDLVTIHYIEGTVGGLVEAKLK